MLKPRGEGHFYLVNLISSLLPGGGTDFGGGGGGCGAGGAGATPSLAAAEDPPPPPLMSPPPPPPPPAPPRLSQLAMTRCLLQPSSTRSGHTSNSCLFQFSSYHAKQEVCVQPAR